jgi:hypothetical protein
MVESGGISCLLGGSSPRHPTSRKPRDLSRPAAKGGVGRCRRFGGPPFGYRSGQAFSKSARSGAPPVISVDVKSYTACLLQGDRPQQPSGALILRLVSCLTYPGLLPGLGDRCLEARAIGSVGSARANANNKVKRVAGIKMNIDSKGPLCAETVEFAPKQRVC